MSLRQKRLSSSAGSPRGGHVMGCSKRGVAVQSLGQVRLFATPWTEACQASLSFTISWSLLKPISAELMMPSNHLIFFHPLSLPSISPSIRVFSNELALRIRWPKYRSFSFSTNPSNEYSGLISFRIFQEKERQKSKMAVWGGLTNSRQKKRSKKQRRKGKI